ncbi:CHAT domain-containing protein [Neolewinella persica]|uniref:CHAT domain-containing protein n=1 Tax=Neolewinella persica TaxID=70998 RepID=UPI0003618679|nr:CHAT domain-containing tetratricopeptide repeat protein [Neolewinella persica]
MYTLSRLLHLIIWPVLCCIASPLVAQQSGTENLSNEPADKLAATARKTDDLRAQQFQRALNWYGQENYAMCRQTIDSLAHRASGELIVDSLSGLAYHMAGMTFYQTYDDVNAVPQYLRAISIRDRCYPGIHNDQAHTRYNLANSMHWLGRPDTATYLLREAVELYDQLERKDSTNWLRSLKLLGIIAKESNDPDLVRSATVAMVNLLETMSKPTPIDKYQVYYDAADNFQFLGEFSASNRTGKAAIAAGYALQAVIPAKDAVSMAADAVNIVASNYRLQGETQRAAAYYRRSIALLDSISGNPTSINIAYANLATLAFDEKDFPEALRLIEITETYPFNPDYPATEASTYRDHARILNQLGRTEEALVYFEKAMVRLSGEGGVTYSGRYPMMVTDSIIDLREGFSLYASRATMLLEAGEPEDALADLRKIFELQDRQRERVNSDGSRYALSSEVRKYYDQAIDLLYHLHQTKGDEQYLWDAFSLSEEAKAYSQLVALRRNRTLSNRREQDLRRKIAVLEREVVGDPEQQVALADAKLRLSLILRSEPNRKIEKVSTLDRSEVQAFLAAGEIELLEFHLNEAGDARTGPESFLFHLLPDGSIRMLKLKVTSGLQASIDTWRKAIQESAYRQKSLRGNQGELDKSFVDKGAALRDILFPGLMAGDLSLGNRLCIIPDGSLNYLPFAALPLSGNGQDVNYATLPYLQTGRSLQLAYSIHYLLELKQRETSLFTEDLLAFAPSFSGEATPGEVSRLRSLRSTKSLSLDAYGALPGLLPLSHNRSEVAAIAGLVPKNEVYYDEAATRNAFLMALGGSRILHLSSHGMVDPDDANLSFVAFAQGGNKLEEDELLYFNDLSTLPIEAELVVLSACETSLGKVAPGESVLSLGSAFAAAGAQSTLTSLWKVDDAATENLMVSFYQHLAAGKTRAEALAEAQQRQRSEGEFAHPYYWSAMTLNGEAGTIEIKGASNWPLWIGGLLVLIGGIWAGTRVQGKG